jgi:archaellum component FlaC
MFCLELSVTPEAMKQSLVDLRSAVPSTGKYSDSWGINSMPIDSSDFVTQIDTLIHRSDVFFNIEGVSSNFYVRVIGIVQALKTGHLPNMMNNQITHIAVAQTLQIVANIFDAALDTIKISSYVELPKRFSTDLRLASRKIAQSLSEVNGIEDRLRTIETAYQTASNLPIVQSELEDAQLEVSKVSTDMIIRRDELLAVAANINELAKNIKGISDRATATMEKVDSSYRAITSQGLATAFKDREAELKRSMRNWVWLLASSLVIAGCIGAERFPILLKTISTKPDWGVVAANMVLAALGMAAPIWFAIVSTKQISQRFKLAEDYGYKAAVSAAYEGYRAEAQRQGDEFEKKLFNSTLNRLDEQPLRFVDEDLGNTPIAEVGKIAKHVVEKVKDATDGVIDRAFSKVDSKEPSKSD